MASKLEIKFAKMQFGMGPRIKMYRRFTSFIKQGVPLFVVMEKFRDLYGKKKGDPRSIALDEWMKATKAGKPFSSAIQGWVPPSEAMLIESGESGGNLPDAFEQAINVTESQQRMKKAIIAGLAYPLITLLMLLGMIFMFSITVVPQLSEFIPPDEWPGASKGLYTMSQIVGNFGLYLLFGVIGLFVLIMKTLPKWTGNLRAKFDKAPPWSIYRSFQGAVFLVALAALMKTGTPLRSALSKLMSQSPPYVKEHLAKMVNNLANGRGNGESLNTGFLSKEIADDVTLYGEVADFEAAMNSIGQEAIEDGVNGIKTASGIVGNIILILTGVFTGWVYYGFFTLTSSIAG